MQDTTSNAVRDDTTRDHPNNDPRGEETTQDTRGDETVHARRSALYGYLAATMQFPDEETVALLCDERVQESVAQAAEALGFSAEFERLQEVLAATTQDRLASTYTDLFGLPGDKGTYPVVPYEAHFTTDGSVNGIQRRIATVVGLLERFGLQPSDDFDERQDHVAVELELMQVVAGQRAVALSDGESEAAWRLARAEATILDEHLIDFVPSLAHSVDGAVETNPGDVDPSASDTVYQAAFDFAAALVRWDVAEHAEIIGDEPAVDREVSDR